MLCLKTDFLGSHFSAPPFAGLKRARKLSGHRGDYGSVVEHRSGHVADPTVGGDDRVLTL